MICDACQRKPREGHKHGKRACPFCHTDFLEGEPVRFYGRHKYRAARLRGRRITRNRERHGPLYGTGYRRAS